MIPLVRIKEFVLLKDYNSPFSIILHIMGTFVKMKVYRSYNYMAPCVIVALMSSCSLSCSSGMNNCHVVLVFVIWVWSANN